MTEPTSTDVRISRDNFWVRLTMLRMAMERIAKLDLDGALVPVEGSPEEELVRAAVDSVRREQGISQRMHQLLENYLDEDGIDPDSWDPYDDHGV